MNPALYGLAGMAAFKDVSGQPPVAAVARVDYANAVDAADGLTTSLRFLNQTQSISIRRRHRPRHAERSVFHHGSRSLARELTPVAQHHRSPDAQATIAKQNRPAACSPPLRSTTMTP